LYQALYGSSPFGNGKLEVLVADVLAGRLRPAPSGARVPTQVRRALVRGLAPAPEDRWPTMSALSAALGRAPTRTRRRGVVAVAALGILSLSAATLLRDARRPGELCHGGPARLATIWSPEGASSPRRDGVRRALLASGLADAGETSNRVAALLDRYAHAWL